MGGGGTIFTAMILRKKNTLSVKIKIFKGYKESGHFVMQEEVKDKYRENSRLAE